MLGAGTMERQQGTRSEWERTERQASRMSERGERVPRETTKRKKCRRTLPYCQTLLIWPGHLHQPNQSPSHGNWFIRKGLPGQKRRSCIISTCCLHIICIKWKGGGRCIFLDRPLVRNARMHPTQLAEPKLILAIFLPFEVFDGWVKIAFQTQLLKCSEFLPQVSAFDL